MARIEFREQASDFVLDLMLYTCIFLFGRITFCNSLRQWTMTSQNTHSP